MELFTIVVLVILGFAILGLGAGAFGVDSRPTMQDDWRRAEMSDAPWLWIVGLGAIALETWLRRQMPWTEDARAA